MSSILEELRTMLKDDSLRSELAVIKSLHLASDGSDLRVTCSLLIDDEADDKEIVAIMTWDCVGPESGFFCFPVAGDMVLINFTEDEEHALVVKRLTSKADKIPKTAFDGAMVMKALASKRVWITSDNRVNFSRGDSEPTENVVLGQIFITFMADYIDEIKLLIDAMKVETHPGSLPGFPTGPPINAAAYDIQKSAINMLKNDTIVSEDILSDLSFTEK